MSSAVSRRYLVLASQRSGSTLLVESLAATGVAGRPAEFFQYLPETSLAPQPRQWFAGVDDPGVLALLDPLEPGEPWRETSDEWRARILAEGATPNGVWGGKLMWNQTSLLVRRATGLTRPPADASLAAAIEAVLGDTVFIRIVREDVVAQAVSFWRAVQTRVWRGRTPADRDARARYDATGIAHLVAELRRQQAGWDAWLAETGIDPIVVTLAELAENPAKQVDRVLDALGLPRADVRPDAPVLRRQGDGRSAEWIERYRADAEANGLPL